MISDWSRSSLLALLLVSASTTVELGPADPTFLNFIANVSYAADSQASESMFSPRMDFEQWKPLTGRGDPLRNDPTYDYEPPVLERVRYWADESRLEREHYPERKSEVLMLGISSRRPSVSSRPPSTPSRKQIRPSPQKYEDFSYKINKQYPLTILVPPPPPPVGYQPQLFILNDEKNTLPVTNIRPIETSTLTVRENSVVPVHLSSLFDVQEANLIYQSSTTSQNWVFDLNQNKTKHESAVSSEYAGWGPTTPLDDIDVNNDTFNFILNDYNTLSKHPYSFYKPMLSESPPAPPHFTAILPSITPTFVPTALPPIVTEQTTASRTTQTVSSPEITTTNASLRTETYYEDTTTEAMSDFSQQTSQSTVIEPEKNVFDMIGPMMSMPLGSGPDRPEDNLYAYATENLHVFKERPIEDIIKLETMQTMQPPPIKKTENDLKSKKNSLHIHPHIVNNLLQKNTPTYNLDPYIHMHFTTSTSAPESLKTTTEIPAAVPYLIIQGHSKVKTYSSKPKEDNHILSNEIPKPNETTEVKHLHPIKEKVDKKPENRKSRAQNLKALVDVGIGSFEIQEADVGIKYDVSDGSDVPVEIYRKGIVDSDENDYSSSTKKDKSKRVRRQLDLEDLLPFDEDDLEEYIFNFLTKKRNETGIAGMIAHAVTSDAAGVVDDLEDDDEDR